MPFIDGLWDIVGEGDVTSIATLADEMLREKSRPFRVAIDAAGLYSAYERNPPTITRSEERYFHRTETAILFRLADLISRNVCPILVFDGPYAVLRRKEYLSPAQPLALLQDLAKKLGVHCMEARAEAEADCAKLEFLGLVDAAWSEEGLAIMYGARRVVRETDEMVLEERSHLRTHFVENVDELSGSLPWLRMNTSNLYGYLVGGRYGITHLAKVPRCTPELARSLVRWYRRQLRSRSWTNTSEGATKIRRSILEQALRACAPGLELPRDFPSASAIKAFDNSRGFSDRDLKQRFESKVQWEPVIDEAGLHLTMRRELNLCTCDYVDRICPALLNLRLRSMPEHEKQDLPLNFYFSDACIPANSEELTTDRYAGLPVDLVIWFRARSVSSGLDFSKCNNRDCHPSGASVVPNNDIPGSVLTKVLQDLLTAAEFLKMRDLIFQEPSAASTPTVDACSNGLPDQIFVPWHRFSTGRARNGQGRCRDSAASSSCPIQGASGDNAGNGSDHGSATSSSSANSSSSYAPTPISSSGSPGSSRAPSAVELRSASGTSHKNTDNDLQPAGRSNSPRVVIPLDELRRVDERIRAAARTQRIHEPSAASRQSSSQGSATSPSASGAKPNYRYNQRGPDGRFIREQGAHIESPANEATLPSSSRVPLAKRRRSDPASQSTPSRARPALANKRRRSGPARETIRHPAPRTPPVTRVHNTNGDPGPDPSTPIAKPKREVVDLTEDDVDKPKSELDDPAPNQSGSRPVAGRSAEARGNQPASPQNDDNRNVYDDFQLTNETVESTFPEESDPDLDNSAPSQTGSQSVAGSSANAFGMWPVVNHFDRSDVRSRSSNASPWQSYWPGAMPAVQDDNPVSHNVRDRSSFVAPTLLAVPDERRVDAAVDQSRWRPPFYQPQADIALLKRMATLEATIARLMK